MTTKAVSVGHGNGVAWREHARLVTSLLDGKYHSDLSLPEDVAHACWEIIRPSAIDIQHTWVAQFGLPRPA